MAKNLQFLIGEREFALEPVKIDRTKLYGKVETVAVDGQGRELEKAYLDDTGSVVVSSSGLGYRTEDGSWAARGDLIAVDETGAPLEQRASSFDMPISLNERVSLDDYFLHEITAVYSLSGADGDHLARVLSESDELYTFPFSYRAGHISSPAFLIPGDGKVFLTVGRKVAIEFLNKQRHAPIDEVDEDDEFDFSMI